MPRKKDTQSVKEALTGRDIADLKQSISDLSLEMKERFAGVHQRQDTTNGKVLKAADDITKLKEENIKRDSKFQYNRLIWYVLTISVTIIGGLLTYISTHHH
jgi:hypothetical protein